VGPTSHATTHVVTSLSHAIRRNAEALVAGLDQAAGGDSRAVHKVRVASRRLRAALPLAAAAAGFDAHDLSRDVRHITRALGDLREADVVSAFVAASETRLQWPPAAAARVQRRCAAERDTCLSKARTRLARVDGADLRARAREVAGRVERESRPGAAAVALATAVGRRARQLAEALDRAGTVYSAEALHQVRLRTKKLRYTLEGASAAIGGTDPRARRHLRSFQDVLGRIHDAQAAQRQIRAAAAGRRVSRALRSAFARMDDDLEIDCRRLHARVVKARPAIDAVIGGTLASIASRLSPRRVGRMARMQADRHRRRPAVGE
jgi:CHAD domain-containing protein